MGYNIGIGELKIDYYQEDEYISLSAKYAEHPDAPDLGKLDMSKKSNYRYPSYTSFWNWCKEVGVTEVFYEIDYLRTTISGEPKHQFKGGHPGCTPLTREMYNVVKNALETYKQKNPNAILPTPENTEHFTSMLDEDTVNDYTLGRLVWFEFWMKWALDNCKQPVISNS